MSRSRGAHAHAAAVEAFADVGEAAVRAGSCPMETWAYVLGRSVEESARFVEGIHEFDTATATGFALAGLVAGRPGSWEAGEVVTMAQSASVPAPPVDTAPALVAVREWRRNACDGGQIIADALDVLMHRRGGPVVGPGSLFAQTSFAHTPYYADEI